MPLDLPSASQDLYARVSRVIPPIEWATMTDDVAAIMALKQQRRAVILAHNYQTPEIFHGVADIVGDSLLLAREAANADADVILLAGVHFMAETAKLMNPGKTVLIPDAAAGCSLAESITAADVALLRQKYPGRPVVAYVNTSAEVKAASDICCTSGNAKKVVESLGVPEVIMLPDEYLAQNVAKETTVKIIAWKGHCEVHELFTPEEIFALRAQHPGVVILAHPECPPAVVEAADFSGSTAVMADFVRTQKPARVALITECSMSDNIAQGAPETEFIRPCNLCPHMKRITLKNIRRALETMQTEVHIPAHLFAPARRSVERMLAVK
jgi:quinolinate synthase